MRLELPSESCAESGTVKEALIKWYSLHDTCLRWIETLAIAMSCNMLYPVGTGPGACVGSAIALLLRGDGKRLE
jgi:hypothetical protein